METAIPDGQVTMYKCQFVSEISYKDINRKFTESIGGGAG